MTVDFCLSELQNALKLSELLAHVILSAELDPVLDKL